MRQKTIVRAVALALALPIGAAWAAPTPRIKPDSMLMVDMNRGAIIDGIVGSWHTNLDATQEKVLRETLAKMRADRLMAASMAPSFEGLLTVLKSADATPVAEKVNEKAVQTQLIYNPIVPCRIVDTRLVGTRFAAMQTQTFDGAASTFAPQGGADTDCGIPASVGVNIFRARSKAVSASGAATGAFPVSVSSSRTTNSEILCSQLNCGSSTTSRNSSPTFTTPCSRS